MKILFFVSSMNAGGAERVAATLASAWADRGDEVLLVPTFPRKGASFYALSDRVKVLWLADRMGGARGRIVVTLKKLPALRALVRQTQPDVVLSFLTNVNIMVLLSTRGLTVPTIASERTSPAAAGNLSPVLRWLRRLAYRWASVVTVQAEASLPAFRRLAPGVRHMAVVPNPLPPALLEMPLAVRSGGSQGRQLAAMGRFHPNKQFSLLIRAFAAVAPDHPEWRLTIWGDGPLRPVLERQIAECGLSDRIALPGRTDTPWDSLAQSDAFALTSSVEGFPNVLLEAMALGLPCLAVDCPSGPREMTRGGQDGLLVPLGDEAALVASLRRLLGDAALRDELAGKAVQSVRSRYALPAVLDRWDEIFALARTQEGR